MLSHAECERLVTTCGGAGQSHLDFELSAGTALKGHGFSRAVTGREKRIGFSR
jgi:hypothetical protein